MKKFIVFLFFLSFSLSLPTCNDFIFGTLKCYENKSNNSFYVSPVKDYIFLKEYNISNLNVSKDIFSNIFTIKKSDNKLIVGLDYEHLLFWTFIFMVIILLQFIISRLVYFKFLKDNKEKQMLFFTIYNVILIFFYLGFFLVFLDFPEFISFITPLYLIKSNFILLNFFTLFLLLFTFLLVTFIITFVNFVAIKEENPFKKTIMFILLFYVPFILFYVIIMLIYQGINYLTKDLFQIFFPIILIFIYLFGAEYYNKFLIYFRSFILNKKIRELPNSEEIKKFFSKYCKINGIKLIDSPGANAFAVGLFKKDIYITPKLYENLNKEELMSVIAHEVGHHYHKHLWKILFILLSIILIINIVPVSDPIKSIFYALFYLFFALGIGFIQNKFEYEADLFAAKIVGKEPTISALIKIHEINKIPKKTSRFFNIIFKHPSLEERIKNIESNI